MKKYFFAFVTMFSLASLAEMTAHNMFQPVEYTTHAIEIPGAERIKLTIIKTALLDSCNHYGIIGDLYPVPDLSDENTQYYLGEYSIMGTEMYCGDDDVPVLQTFTVVKEVPGPSLMVLLPADLILNAEDANP